MVACGGQLAVHGGLSLGALLGVLLGLLPGILLGNLLGVGLKNRLGGKNLSGRFICDQADARSLSHWHGAIWVGHCSHCSCWFGNTQRGRRERAGYRLKRLRGKRKFDVKVGLGMSAGIRSSWRREVRGEKWDVRGRKCEVGGRKWKALKRWEVGGRR